MQVLSSEFVKPKHRHLAQEKQHPGFRCVMFQQNFPTCTLQKIFNQLQDWFSLRVSCLDQGMILRYLGVQTKSPIRNKVREMRQSSTLGRFSGGPTHVGNIHIKWFLPLHFYDLQRLTTLGTCPFSKGTRRSEVSLLTHLSTQRGSPKLWKQQKLFCQKKGRKNGYIETCIHIMYIHIDIYIYIYICGNRCGNRKTLNKQHHDTMKSLDGSWLMYCM